jgi:acyl carrier protein
MSTYNENKIEQLKNIILPYVQNAEMLESLSEETDFIRDLNINSSNLVDIVLDIEEKFDIVIDNTSMERMTNVKAALEIIEEKLNPTN